MEVLENTLTGTEPYLAIKYDAGWGPQPVWTVLGTEPWLPSPQSVTLLYQVSRVTYISNQPIN
jgi:hypothetical protein